MPTEFTDAIPPDNGTGGGSDAINPAAATAPGEPAAPKRRGRPPGSGRTTSGAGKEKTSNKLDLSSLTGLFIGVHVIAANMTGVPELVISEQEGKDFFSAINNVARHYNVQTTQKTVDWIALLGCTATIYGTRFGAYMLRKRSDAAKPINTGYAAAPTPANKNNGAQHHAPVPGAHFNEASITDVQPEYENQDG